jgi:hypothetical protein
MELNPYLNEIRQSLPRLLALFDADPTSASYGMGDRYYWAWGLIDFGNGTFQGAAHGLARLWVNGLWPYETSKERFHDRIDSLFVGTSRITRRNGSLEEAFPNEGSYCVTALVAYDLLCTLDLMGDEIDSDTKIRWQEIIRPLIDYLIKADETHAIISNHLATAVASLVRWHKLTSEKTSNLKAKQLMDRILEHQSKEGWFREYEGSDPGYQSLCTNYLEDVHRLRPDWKLLEPLSRSIRFLWNFAHPDGSFGGIYGSRCTRFYYPAGVLALANEIPEARSLANFMANSIVKRNVVTMSTMDEPNLVPMFNSYCWAAALASKRSPAPSLAESLPALKQQSFRQHFPGAGLLIDRGPRHYSIVATGNGGVVYHFIDQKLKILNTGVVVQNTKGEFGSSQTATECDMGHLDGNEVRVSGPIVTMPKELPGPWQFIVLRFLSVTFFRFPMFRERIKRQLVKLLITGRKSWPCSNRRTIYLGKDLRIEDQTELPSGYEQVKDVTYFVPIHMASQGYWQIQDERKP